MFTASTLRRLWPNAKQSLIDGIAAAAPGVFAKHGMDSDLIVAHAMAQFSHECGEGLEMVENIRYSAARACEVWPSRFHSAADCYSKVGSFPGDPNFPNKLINSVYGGRMGNRPGTQDGVTFIGRGLSQTTGREEYEKLGKIVGLDLVSNPDLVCDPALTLECGVADFIQCGCLPFAKADNLLEVTKHLNGGTIGLAERKMWLSRWKAALAVDHFTTSSIIVPAATHAAPIPDPAAKQITPATRPVSNPVPPQPKVSSVPANSGLWDAIARLVSAVFWRKP